MRKGALKSKSFRFAVRIVNLQKYLRKEFSEYIMSRQILRSGTAIAALIREAEYAESTDDFKHKLKISLKETNETIYWLQLLHKTKYITDKMFGSMIKDVNEIIRMLTSSINTINKKANNIKKNIDLNAL